MITGRRLFGVALMVVLPLATAVAFHPNTQCYRCHVPHEDASLAGMPLWSGLKTTIADWTPYSSPTLDAQTGDPGGSPLVCLAGHDGTSDGSVHAVSDGLGDLSGSHPIEFVYDEALADLDKELVNPDEPGSSTEINGEGTITADFLAGGANGTKKMNCASCHEVHVNGLHEGIGGDFTFSVPHLKSIPGIEMKVSWGGDPSNDQDYYLAYSDLCRTCHIK